MKIKLQKLVGNLQASKIVHEWNGHLEIFSRLYMVYTAALPRVSAGSVVLSRHEGPF